MQKLKQPASPAMSPSVKLRHIDRRVTAVSGAVAGAVGAFFGRSSGCGEGAASGAATCAARCFAVSRRVQVAADDFRRRGHVRVLPRIATDDAGLRVELLLLL